MPVSGLGVGESGFIPADLLFDSPVQRGDRRDGCHDGKIGGHIDVFGRTNRPVEEARNQEHQHDEEDTEKQEHQHDKGLGAMLGHRRGRAAPRARCCSGWACGSS